MIRRLRKHALIRVIHHFGLAPVRRLLVPNDEIAALAPPVILATFHIGPTHALGAVMEQLPGEVLVLRRQAYAPAQPANVRVAETGGSEERRALAFRDAVAHLRGGGYVLLTIDPATASRVEAPFFEKKLLLARGAFALSRVARAPIVPIVTRWRGARIVVECGPRIGPSQSEEELAAATAKWLEGYLTRWPGEATARTFGLLLRES